MSDVLIRRSVAADERAVDVLVGDAFRRDAVEPIEVGLLRALRDDAGWLERLSLVAEDARGEVVGYVVGTRATVGGAPAVGIGPVAVRPDAQDAGVGSALMRALLAAAQASGETVVGLLGEPDFYGRFGLTAASDLGIESPDPSWGGFFQARRLTDDAPTGRFAYAAPFDDL